METLQIRPALYANRRLALEIISEDGLPWGMLTTNIIDATLADDEVCIPEWNLPRDFLDSYLASGQFEDTGKTVPTGFVEAPIWRVSSPELLATAEHLRQTN